jgi:hypothetical protein
VNVTVKQATKVKLTKAQSDALISALEDAHGDKVHIVKWHFRELWSSQREALNGLDPDILIEALYVGYEVENLEEKLKEYFMEHLLVAEQSYDAGVLDGVRTTLNYLNIQIKGVNC